ncbi:MAG: DUF924 domain-containing protein [Hyphomonas sp.]|nr:DUF924 domain-containing protein [Hyphomonas sp.]
MSALPTPQDVLDFWIGDATNSPEAAGRQNKLWFTKSDETDAELRARFGPLLETLSHLPAAEDWAARGPQGRLAAIIVLDQFSRNLFRGDARAFHQDGLALLLAKDGIALGEDTGLSECERIFWYLPFEHSEAPEDQDTSVALFTALHRDAREGFKGLVESTLDYAHAHKAVIDRFGRYPHRNEALGRASTEEETAWLAKGGGF